MQYNNINRVIACYHGGRILQWFRGIRAQEERRRDNRGNNQPFTVWISFFFNSNNKYCYLYVAVRKQQQRNTRLGLLWPNHRNLSSTEVRLGAPLFYKEKLLPWRAASSHSDACAWRLWLGSTSTTNKMADRELWQFCGCAHVWKCSGTARLKIGLSRTGSSQSRCLWRMVRLSPTKFQFGFIRVAPCRTRQNSLKFARFGTARHDL